MKKKFLHIIPVRWDLNTGAWLFLVLEFIFVKDTL